MISTRVIRSPLKLRSPIQETKPERLAIARPPIQPRDLWLLWGGQGKRVGLKGKFILRELGVYSVSFGAIDGDAGDWPMLEVPGYEPIFFEPDEFIVLGADKTRDDLRADPSIRARYEKAGLWRGVPVSETFQRGGKGGLSYPSFAAAFYESERERALEAMHKWIMPLIAEPREDTTGSDLERLVQKRRKAKNAQQTKSRRIVQVGGDIGSWGPTGHVLGSYDIRMVTKSLGMRNYELLGVMLGPNLYENLTHNIKANFHAVIDQMQYLYQHGLHRTYGGHGADVDMDVPPYDPGRLFLADQARGPRNGRRATEEELEMFQWNVALSLVLLLATDAGDQLVSYASNPSDQEYTDRERASKEIFGTLGSALAGVDILGITKYLEQKTKVKLLSDLRGLI